ncbi:hypothetical protein Y88_3578 [Novosphingobium nitrogenifigens DSM 19370]|uniref:Uncharacterized protein n=1 Tax=Novosphingobium nitrogenifigens DSM 19370 TaxID=983920 RepID=F1ZDJ0_9SPHN|nr:hypothetical protein Y88_3578 [Novosphingobium nitrogenifigens DSM 19370]
MRRYREFRRARRFGERICENGADASWPPIVANAPSGNCITTRKSPSAKV